MSEDEVQRRRSPRPNFVDLAMPVPLDGAFTYAIPAGMVLRPGMAVRAPWGSRTLTGVVVGLRETPPDGIAVREIAEPAEPEPVLDAALLELVRWSAAYYQAPLGEVMRCAVPPGSLREPKRAPRARAAVAFPARPRVEQLNSSQQRALAAIQDSGDRRPILLHGVTGSGKTAVYLAAIEAVLERGEAALLLVPEIGLTPALFADFGAA
ncbi:MAG: DEAD/DEAH box helicase family protein, partial [Terriglobales bacterium]